MSHHGLSTMKNNRSISCEFYCKDATRDDAGATGLRRHMKVKAFFDNLSQNAISPAELAEYYQNHGPIDEDSAKFFFLE